MNSLFDIGVDALEMKTLLRLHHHRVQLLIDLYQIMKNDDLYFENNYLESVQEKSRHRLCIFAASDIH